MGQVGREVSVPANSCVLHSPFYYNILTWVLISGSQKYFYNIDM